MGVIETKGWQQQGAVNVSFHKLSKGASLHARGSSPAVVVGMRCSGGVIAPELSNDAFLPVRGSIPAVVLGICVIGKREV